MKPCCLSVRFAILESVRQISCGESSDGSTVDKVFYFGDISGGVLYNLSVSALTAVTASTCASHHYDTALAIYDYNLRRICHNDNFCGEQSFMSCSLSEGSYLVVVSGSITDEGDYDLDVSCEDGEGKRTSVKQLIDHLTVTQLL
jgi:hypothetical protein